MKYPPYLILCFLFLFSQKLLSQEQASSDSKRKALVVVLEQMEPLPLASEDQVTFLQTHFPVVAATYCDALNVLSPYHQDEITGSDKIIGNIISETSDGSGINHYAVVQGKKEVVVGYLQNDSLQLINSNITASRTTDSSLMSSNSKIENETIVEDVAVLGVLSGFIELTLIVPEVFLEVFLGEEVFLVEGLMLAVAFFQSLQLDRFLKSF